MVKSLVYKRWLLGSNLELVNFIRVVFLLKKAKHGLSLIISVRLYSCYNWYNGKVSGSEGMAVRFKSRASQFHQSRFFFLKRLNMG